MSMAWLIGFSFAGVAKLAAQSIDAASKPIPTNHIRTEFANFLTPIFNRSSIKGNN